MQTSNKHIFIVTYDYPPSNGGIARLCFELKKYLEKKGLNVTVICPQSTSTDAEEDNHPFCPGDTQYESGCHRNHRGNQSCQCRDRSHRRVNPAFHPLIEL